MKGLKVLALSALMVVGLGVGQARAEYDAGMEYFTDRTPSEYGTDQIVSNEIETCYDTSFNVSGVVEYGDCVLQPINSGRQSPWWTQAYKNYMDRAILEGSRGNYAEAHTFFSLAYNALREDRTESPEADEVIRGQVASGIAFATEKGYETRFGRNPYAIWVKYSGHRSAED
jgi:hypothetical protein